MERARARDRHRVTDAVIEQITVQFAKSRACSLSNNDTSSK